MERVHRLPGEGHGEALNVTRRGRARPRAARGAILGAALALVLGLAGRRASAQVNAETLRKGLDHDGITGAVEGSLTGRTGNTEGLVAGGSVSLAFVDRPHSGFLFAKGDYVHLGGATQVARSFVHARGNEQLAPWLWVELFGQAQQDEFLRLRLRTLLGVGPRARLFADAEWSIFLGSAYMLEREVVALDTPGSPSEFTIAHRFSNYLAIAYKASDLVTLTSTTYVQPRFDDFRDVRSLEEANLVIAVTKRLTTKLGCTLRYDSRPPAGVKTSDVEVRNSIAVTW
jgi:hypothetical protein